MTLGSFTSNSDMQSAARRFVAKGFLLVAVFYGVTFAASATFDRVVDWRARQDLRRQLLWDSRTADVDIVLLGDSVFVSSFVDSSRDLLVNVLQRTTGKRVFNAALTGADPPDFLKAARLLEGNGTRNAIIVQDVMPTRFLPKKHPDPSAGNYPGEFASRVSDNWLMDELLKLKRPLLILDRDLLMDTMFHRGEYRNLVWTRDGDLARQRFETFEKEFTDSDAYNFDWIGEMDSSLGQSGNKLVVMITPINSWLVRQYSTKANAEKYLGRFERSREALIRYLTEHNVPYIDGTAQGASEDFGDLVHPNTSGNRLFATLIANYIAGPEKKMVIASGAVN